MSSRITSSMAAIVRPLIEHRLIVSCGLSVASGMVLQNSYPLNAANPLLRLIALERPAIFEFLVWSYTFFLYSTPFLGISVLLSFVYVHFYSRDLSRAGGPLPEYPDPRTRHDLFLVVGEVHHRLKPDPSPQPRWAAIPDLGLFTGTNVIGATGSAKTQGFILPAMRQLFGFGAKDPARKLSGIVLEVKGDL